MSRKVVRKVKCPLCGEESDFTIWEAINTGEDPEMHAAVRDGSAFDFVCPFCDYKADVQYECMYNQAEDKILIQYAASDETAKAFFDSFTPSEKENRQISPVAATMLEEGYLVRLVRTKNQLREKLAIFDAGLDDRTVEVIKLLLFARLRTERPDVNVDDGLMYTDEEGRNMIEYSLEGKPVIEVEMTKKMYNNVKDIMSRNVRDIRKESVVVNKVWAKLYLDMNKMDK